MALHTTSQTVRERHPGVLETCAPAFQGSHSVITMKFKYKEEVMIESMVTPVRPSELRVPTVNACQTENDLMADENCAPAAENNLSCGGA